MKRSAVHRYVIHRHSGWLIPLGVGLAVLLLCGLFMLWYLRPGAPSGALSGNPEPVTLSVQGLRLAVPANHIETMAARAGGTQKMLALFALFPDMRGYSPAEAQLFAGNAPDSPLIHVVLRGDPNGMTVQGRLARIYAPALTDPAGRAAPFGLTQYGFRPLSIYSRDDLFAGETEYGPVLLLCERALPELPSPNCLATANPPAKNLGLTYRFKRAYLSNWKQIATSVDSMLAQFRKH